MPAPAVGQRLYGTADLGRRTLPARTHLYLSLIHISQADVIVAALGESSEMSGESSSRSELEMPDAQRHLLALGMKL